jgi:hypothetical protein
MEAKTTTCPNCEKETFGNFCHHCGQKQGINRLTWGSVFGELQKRWFGFDNNFLRTVKDLTIKPHKVVEASIEGVRVRYIGPVGYYFLMLTIYVLIISFLDIDINQFYESMNQSFNPEVSAEQQALQKDWNNFVNNNFRIVAFLMMPFFILGIWIVFKNKGYNFLETAVLNFYGQGHPMLVSIVMMVVYKFTNDGASLLTMTAITYLYLLVVITLFYKGNKLWNFIKGIFGILLGFILLMLFTVAVVFLIGWTFPELFSKYTPQ